MAVFCLFVSHVQVMWQAEHASLVTKLENVDVILN